MRSCHGALALCLGLLAMLLPTPAGAEPGEVAHWWFELDSGEAQEAPRRVELGPEATSVRGPGGWRCKVGTAQDAASETTRLLTCSQGPRSASLRTACQGGGQAGELVVKDSVLRLGCELRAPQRRTRGQAPPRTAESEGDAELGEVVQDLEDAEGAVDTLLEEVEGQPAPALQATAPPPIQGPRTRPAPSRPITGHGCRYASDCPVGLCDQGFCRAPGRAPAGYACRYTSDCAAGFCDQGTCRSGGKARPGTGCRYASDCAAGFCDQGICRAAGRAEPGFACRYASDCARGLCDQGLCRASGGAAKGSRCRYSSDCTRGYCDRGLCR